MEITPLVLAYGLIYLASLVLAYRHRKTFPFSDSVMVVLIVGIGFTGLVALVTLWMDPPTSLLPVPPSQVAFTLLYLTVTAILLVIKKSPRHWQGHFFKEQVFSLLFKLLVFVILPIAALRSFWNVSWADLGFTTGNPKQLLAATVLIIFFGGFNLIAGGGAAPLRKREFSTRQVMLGFSITFLWNLVEVGLVEEFFFRAFLQTRLIHALGSPLAGICMASLLFGLAHSPGIYLRKGDKLGPLGERPSLLDSILYGIVVLSVAGWFTGLLYWRTQSLLAPILVHAAVDSVAHAADFIRGLQIRK